MGRVSAEILARTRQLARSPADERVQWTEIERLLEQFEKELDRYEPVLVAMDDYADLKENWPGDMQATEAASRLLDALDRFALAEISKPGAKAPPPPPGMTRAGDVQLPLGDREGDNADQ
jgi:hypothetical protein